MSNHMNESEKSTLNVYISSSVVLLLALGLQSGIMSMLTSCVSSYPALSKKLCTLPSMSGDRLDNL